MDRPPGIHCREDGTVTFARGTKFHLWDAQTNQVGETYVCETHPRLYLAGLQNDYYLFAYLPADATKVKELKPFRTWNKLLALHKSVFTEVEQSRLESFIIKQVKQRLEDGK